MDYWYIKSTIYKRSLILQLNFQKNKVVRVAKLNPLWWVHFVLHSPFVHELFSGQFSMGMLRFQSQRSQLKNDAPVFQKQPSIFCLLIESPVNIFSCKVNNARFPPRRWNSLSWATKFGRLRFIAQSSSPKHSHHLHAFSSKLIVFYKKVILVLVILVKLQL